MSLRTFAATVRLHGAGHPVTQQVFVEANDANKAKLMLVTQYGAGNVTGVHPATGSDLRRAGK